MLKTTLEAQAILTDAIRKTSEVYTEALAAAMKALADLPRESGELHRRAVEQWLGLARTNKENFVAAVNQHPSPGRRMRHEINYAYRHGPRPRRRVAGQLQHGTVDPGEPERAAREGDRHHEGDEPGEP